LQGLGGGTGAQHIAYLRLAPNKSLDSSLLTAITTYPKERQTRYFAKQYFLIDPTLRHSSTLLANFDWQDIERENQALRLQHSARKLQICLEHNEIRFWTSTVRLRAGA
jgi:hypothetical protein